MVSAKAYQTRKKPTFLVQGIKLLEKGRYMDNNSRTNQAHTFRIYKTYRINRSTLNMR